MALAPSVTETNSLTVLRSFLLSVLPAPIEVFKGQGNRVPEPQTEQFVMMTPITRTRLETNTDTWDTTNSNPSVISLLTPTQYGVQLDFHGEGSTDNVQTILMLWRDGYSCDYFTASGYDIQPLYTSEPMQAPFDNGEGQYEDRWTMDVMMQANPVLTPAQQFAPSVSIVPVSVDATYPP